MSQSQSRPHRQSRGSCRCAHCSALNRGLTTTRVSRFAAYGESHGTWEVGTGYAEGILARIIEAVLGQPPVLPSVRADPNFLCGTEFSTLTEETLFFSQRGLSVEAVVIEVRLQPGELLLLDNLALAHGRQGSRAPGAPPGNLRTPSTTPSRADQLSRDRVLAAFSG